MVSEITASWQQLFEQGKHAYANKDLAHAEELFRSAIEQGRYNGASADVLAEMSFNLGVCYHSKQDFFNAEQCYNQALLTLESTSGENSEDVATILRHLSNVYRQTNRADQSQMISNRADAIEAKLAAPQSTVQPQQKPPQSAPQPVESPAQKSAPRAVNGNIPRTIETSHSTQTQPDSLDYEQRVAIAAQREPHSYIDVNEMVHPREKMYGSFSAAFGWFVYGLSCLLLVGLILAPLSLLGNFIVGGLHLGALRSRGIKVSPDQFPEVNALIEKYCTLLRMEVPEVYVVQEHGLLNAFANRLHRKDRIVINSDVLELAYKQGERELAFVVVHELTHVKRGHVRWAWLHIPADMIPFLGSAYSRACEYTCDRVASHLVPDGALYGLVALATGTKLYRRVNLQALYDQQEAEWGFWTWYHEIQSSHPNLINRIRAIGIADDLASQSFSHHQ